MQHKSSRVASRDAKVCASFYGGHIDAPKARICIEKMRGERIAGRRRIARRFAASNTSFTPGRDIYPRREILREAGRKFSLPLFLSNGSGISPLLSEVSLRRRRFVVHTTRDYRLIVRYVTRRSEEGGSPALLAHAFFA